MKLPGVVFALLVALCLLTLAAALLEEPANGAGLPHLEFESMRVGGSGALRHQPLLELGFAIGAVQLALFTSLLGFGARKRERLRGLGRSLAVGGALYGAAWCGLMWAYAAYLDDPAPSLWLAFPGPTAWMLYLLGPAPLIFAWAYYRGFARFIYTAEDAAEFRALLERARGGG